MNLSQSIGWRFLVRQPFWQCVVMAADTHGDVRQLSKSLNLIYQVSFVCGVDKDVPETLITLIY